MLISSNLRKPSTIFITKFTTSTRTDITLQTIVKGLRVLIACSTFKREHWHEERVFSFFEKVNCPNKMCFLNNCAEKILATFGYKKISVCSKHIYVSGAHYSLGRMKKIVSAVELPMDSRNWRDTKMSLSFQYRCLLSGKVLLDKKYFYFHFSWRARFRVVVWKARFSHVTFSLKLTEGTWLIGAKENILMETLNL